MEMACHNRACRVSIGDGMRYLHLPGCSLRCQPALAQCHRFILKVPPSKAPAAVGKQLQLPRIPGSVHGAHCGDHSQHAGRRGGCFWGGCSGGDKGRVGGAPGVTTCERLLGTRVRCDPSLLLRLPMSSCGHKLEHTGKSFLQLPRLRSQPPPCSLPPSFIYGTAISFWREVASIMKWQKDLNEYKVFA